MEEKGIVQRGVLRTPVGRTIHDEPMWKSLSSFFGHLENGMHGRLEFCPNRVAPSPVYLIL